MLDTTGKIEITGVDLPLFVAAVYDLSSPQGFGFLQFHAGPLSKDQIRALCEDRGDKSVRLALDYVNGRACKMVIWRGEGDRLWIRPDWYDHGPALLRQLLERVGITAGVPASESLF